MPQPVHYAVALFPGFQALDAFGPLDALNILSSKTPLRLSILAVSLAPVSTLMPSSDLKLTIGQSVVPTHTFDDAPDDIDVLLVPGGVGTRDAEVSAPVVAFIAKWAKCIEVREEECERWLLTVCTGSALAAQAGVLDGKRATSNKSSFDWVMSQGPDVNWVRKARWVADGHTWTSSGVTAGMDMIYDFIGAIYGQEMAQTVARIGEYVPNKNPSDDQFADLYD